jgi:hypothetical protein
MAKPQRRIYDNVHYAGRCSVAILQHFRTVLQSLFSLPRRWIRRAQLAVRVRYFSREYVMWEQLIRRQDRERSGIDFEQIESPFFCEKDHPERLEPFGFIVLIYDGGVSRIRRTAPTASWNECAE